MAADWPRKHMRVVPRSRCSTRLDTPATPLSITVWLPLASTYYRNLCDSGAWPEGAPSARIIGGPSDRGATRTIPGHSSHFQLHDGARCRCALTRRNPSRDGDCRWRVSAQSLRYRADPVGTRVKPVIETGHG